MALGQQRIDEFANPASSALERRRPSPQEGWAGSTFFKMVDLAGVEAPTLRGESPRLPVDVPPSRPAPVAPRAADPGVRMGSQVVPISPLSGIQNLD
jgi:hypothetical protein